MTVRSLFLKSRNKFTVDVLDTTATHAGVVTVIKWQHSQLYFRGIQTSIGKNEDEKSSEKLLRVKFFLNSILVGRDCEAFFQFHSSLRWACTHMSHQLS